MATLTTSTDKASSSQPLSPLETPNTLDDTTKKVDELQVKLNAVKIDQNKGEPKMENTEKTKTEETTEEASPIEEQAKVKELELLIKWRANYKIFKEKCGAPNRFEMSNSDGGMKIFFVLLSMKLIEVDVLPSMKFCDFLRMYAEKTGKDMPGNRFVFAAKSLGSNGHQHELDRTFAEYNIENNDMILVLHRCTM